MIRQRLIGAGLGLLFLWFAAFTVYFTSEGHAWRALLNMLNMVLIVVLFMKAGTS